MLGARPPGDDVLDLRTDIARVLTELARQRPLLIVWGDLRDADLQSLELIQYLAYLAVEHGWLMMGAASDAEVHDRPELRRMLEIMMHDRLCMNLQLQPLASPDRDELVRVLLGGDVDKGLLEYIGAWTRGNPLFIEALVRAMYEAGQVALAGDRWQLLAHDELRVPECVRALSRNVLARLGEPARRVLALTAAAGSEGFSLTRLCTSAAALRPPLSEGDLFDALDLVLEAGLLEECPSGYAFVHPLLRAAMYDELPRHRRDQLHVALAGR
jgi:predicted ATPase